MKPNVKSLYFCVGLFLFVVYSGDDDDDDDDAMIHSEKALKVSSTMLSSYCRR